MDTVGVQSSGTYSKKATKTMAIRFDHQAAGVVPPSNASTRKYGQNLVLQQNQQKYAGQQAGYDRLFTLGRDQQQNQFQWTRDLQQNSDRAARDKQLNEWRQQEAEKARQQGFLDDARKQSSGIIMEDINNGAYDPATSRKLRENLVAEAEALGNPNLDATQRAEALAKIRAERALLTANRIEPPPKPSPEDDLNSGIVTRNGIDFRKNKDGVWEPIDYGKGRDGQGNLIPPQEPSRPTSVDDAIAADPKVLDPYIEREITAQTQGGTLTPDLLEKARERARLQYEKDLGLGTPTTAPDVPGAQPTSPGEQPPLKSILETPQAAAPSGGIPVAPPDPGQPPRPQSQNSNDGTAGQQAPAAAQQTPPPQAQPPSAGEAQQREPLPLTNSPSRRGRMPLTNSPSQNAKPSPQQQKVTVNGKPLAVTPGTLTPQETAARSQIMELPREDRIKALMPYDQELKGKTIDQILESPESKAQYKSLTEQGLTTGNYREDMLGHIDEMLQHNVLNAAGQAPQDAYVGMNVGDITDPKMKLKVEKLPRPKSKNDRSAIRSGDLYIDPEGVIRARA